MEGKYIAQNEREELQNKILSKYARLNDEDRADLNSLADVLIEGRHVHREAGEHPYQVAEA
jgi:hypothetical protein